MEKNCHNFELYSDGAEVLAWSLCNLVNKAIFIPDQCNIAKVKPLFKRGSKSDRKITRLYHCYLLCLRKPFTL